MDVGNYTTLAPLAVPSGTSDGDLVVFSNSAKDPGCTVSAPTNWTNSFTEHHDVKYSTTWTPSTNGGEFRLRVFTAEFTSGDDTTPDFTLSPSQTEPVDFGAASFYTSGGTYRVETTTGEDSDGATNEVSITGDATLLAQSGDYIVVTVHGTSRSSALSNISLSVPGCTVGAAVYSGGTSTTRGTDSSTYTTVWPITAGTAATGAPTFTADDTFTAINWYGANFTLVSDQAAPSGSTTHNGAASLTATSAHSAAAVRAVIGAAAMTAAATASSAGTAVAVASTDLSIQSALTATATTAATESGSAALTVESAATASALLVAQGTAALTAQSEATSTASVGGLASASLSAQSSATASGVVVQSATATLSAQSSTSASGVIVIPAASGLSGATDATASGVVVVPAAAALSGDTAATAAAEVILAGVAVLSATSSVSAAGSRTAVASAALTAETSVSAAPTEFSVEHVSTGTSRSGPSWITPSGGSEGDLVLIHYVTENPNDDWVPTITEGGWLVDDWKPTTTWTAGTDPYMRHITYAFYWGASTTGGSIRSGTGTSTDYNRVWCSLWSQAADTFFVDVTHAQDNDTAGEVESTTEDSVLFYPGDAVYTVTASAKHANESVLGSEALTLGGSVTATRNSRGAFSSGTSNPYPSYAEFTIGGTGSYQGTVDFYAADTYSGNAVGYTTLFRIAHQYPTPLLGSADLTIESGVTATGVRVRPADASLSAETEVTATGTRVVVPTADLSAETSSTSSAVRNIPTAVDLSGEASLTAVGTFKALPTTSMSVESSMGVDAYRVFYATMTATADTVATASTPLRKVPAALSMESVSTIGVTGPKQIFGNPTASMSIETGFGLWSRLITFPTADPMTVDTSLGADGAIFNTAYCDMSIGSAVFVQNTPYLTFLKPTYSEYFPNKRRLLEWYDVQVGQTVIVKNGEVTVTAYPTQTQLKEADWYILGGHNHRITEQQAEVLENAGYGHLFEYR